MFHSTVFVDVCERCACVVVGYAPRFAIVGRVVAEVEFAPRFAIGGRFVELVTRNAGGYESGVS